MTTWTETIGGQLYSLQSFTASGTWTVPAGITSVDVLVVAGGGGGARQGNGGGGGGAGGCRWVTGHAVVPAAVLTVTVGAGGAGGTATTGPGGDGGGSVFNTITTVGGGGGGAGTSGTPANDGHAGGSGGGGSGSTAGNPTTGGAGTSGQGSNGAAGGSSAGSASRNGGGGGGKGGVGQAANVAAQDAGDGGAGFDATTLVGTTVGEAGWFASGGAGGAAGALTHRGVASAGGGGDGGYNSVLNGSNGDANTGGGGGGGANSAGNPSSGTGGNGGSGIVIVRWIAVAGPNVPTSVAVTNASDHSLELSWSAPSGGGSVTSYDVRIDGDEITGQTSPHVFSGLDPSTFYSLAVRAVGPGGSSAWVTVVETTLADTTPPGYYRVVLTAGDYSWDVDSEDTATYGPRLPLSMGWSIPDTVEFFPAAPDLATLTFTVLVESASDLSELVKGDTVTMDMYVDDAFDATPWQSFSGVVTQLDGAPFRLGPTLGFLVTVYAVEDPIRLADLYVGISDDWPVESIYDRIARICTEAGVDISNQANTGLEGWLRPRLAGDVLSVLDALRACLKDAADKEVAGPDTWYGRQMLGFHPGDPIGGLDPAQVYVVPFQRRVFPDSTTTLDGCKTSAQGQWTKQTNEAGAENVYVDGVQFGTGAGVPIVRNTSLYDYTGDPEGTLDNQSEVTRDALGNSLLADGSTMLSGWAARLLRYEAHLDPEPVTHWASPMLHPTGSGGQDRAPVVRPVVITPLVDSLELNGDDYLAGTLTGARLVIPPGGRFYLELRLRSELLVGTDLPA